MASVPPGRANIIIHWMAGDSEPVPVQFNPTELQLEKQSQFAEIGIPGLIAPLQQFVRGQAEVLTVELFFDTSDKGTGANAESVAKQTDLFYALARIEPTGHAPPPVTFKWGSEFPGKNLPEDKHGTQKREGFTGVVTSVRQTFTMWSRGGVPLRAKLNLTLREYIPLEDQLKQLNPSSPDRTHGHVLRAGESLPSLAHLYWLRPSEWRRIATDNGIEDPRRLTPGRNLRVPRIDTRGAAPVSVTYKPVVEESARPEHRHLYAPAFDVRVSGKGLPETALHDIVELTYRDSLTEIDQFEITVNNWDAAKRVCKYIGSEEPEDLEKGDEHGQLLRLFEPCSKLVAVSFGYVGRQLLMMTGNFTTMEPNFPSSGPPVLTVRGLNVLHQLRRKKYSTAWEQKKPSFIARNISTLSDGGKPRFPCKIEVNDEAERGEAPIPYVTQSDQSDIDFLLNFARQHGYELFVQEFDDAGKPKALYFGPGTRARAPVNYRLDWGRTLIDFKPSLTTAGQFKSVTVRGWDRRAQKPIKEKVAYDDPEVKRMNANMREMIVDCDPREDQVVDLPVFNKADARKRAIGLMLDNKARMVKATGSTVGLPELRAGTKIDIQGVGSRLRGEYLVTKTTHTIGAGGYVTKFECRREDFTEPAR